MNLQKMKMEILLNFNIKLKQKIYILYEGDKTYEYEM